MIVAGTRPLPPRRRVYDRHPLVYRLGGPVDAPAGVEVVDAVDLPAVFKDLGARMVVDALVEGGPRLAGSLVTAGLIDRVVLYFAGKLAGGVGRPMFDRVFATLGDAGELAIDEVTRLGGDLRIDGRMMAPGGWGAG